jgi:hypothetical protein
VVRQGSAKPLFVGSIPTLASTMATVHCQPAPQNPAIRLPPVSHCSKPNPALPVWSRSFAVAGQIFKHGTIRLCSDANEPAAAHDPDS